MFLNEIYSIWNNQLCERGTTISLFDYAHHNESILKINHLFFMINQPI